MADNVDLKYIAESKRLEGFSGADIATLVKEAGLKAIIKKENKIYQKDFEDALDKVMPSISEKDRI
jgi:ATP-dependent 26S proteasome regulatory subunit